MVCVTVFNCGVYVYARSLDEPNSNCHNAIMYPRSLPRTIREIPVQIVLYIFNR